LLLFFSCFSDGGAEAAAAAWGGRPKQFSCEMCGKRYSNKNSLHNHMGIHRGVTNCHLCHTVFSSKSNLNFHMKNVHGRPA
jgi:transcription elongation factor Elf1